MSWSGSNPFAALSQPSAHAGRAQTQREEPAPKKHLALAKDATKVVARTEPAPAEVKAEDPKKHAGNNSAKPGRPERSMDRKGRTYDKPKKGVPGQKDERVKRDGKDWGEGRKRVEDGATEAEGRPRRERRDREAKPELTDEEKAALEAQRALEARQMTLEEYNAKRAGTAAPAATDLKEARKVEMDPALAGRQHVKADLTAHEWAAQPKKKQGENKKTKAKKETLVVEAPRKKRDEAPRGGPKHANNAHNNHSAPPVNLADDALFPALGK